MFNTLLVQPLIQTLNFIAPLLGGYGFAIIAMTIVIRFLLLPLSLPALKSAKKIQSLQPEIEKLKKLHKDDKPGLQQAQLELFKTHNVNPASGCLPQIFQLVILIALYRVFTTAVGPNTPANLTSFLWMNITHKDPTYILPILAAITQLIMGVMILPATSTAAETQNALETKDKQDDKAADDMSSMAASMQSQMVFMMPVMTLMMSINFPSGLTLYWVVTTIISIIQQYTVSGWGGLPLAVEKARKFLKI